jgi:hypothetical protein
MTIKVKTVQLIYCAIVILLGTVIFLCGCPPMTKQVRQAQQQTETVDECHDFIMPAPASFIGDQCPRTDQRAEISGGFVVCHCKMANLDGGL